MKEFLGVSFADCDYIKGLDLSDLYNLEIAQNKIRLAIIKKHMDNGVIFMATDGVFIDNTVKIGKDTIIYADNQLRGTTSIGNSCVLESGNIITDAFIGNEVSIIKSILRDCKIDNKTTIGPFANIHTNSTVGKECRIGNFMEIKNATIGINTKMAHLAYIGDVDIGNQCNIGCGSIFVNYDGKNKHRSSIGDSVFIGSNSNIIAPVRIDDNAYIAAGSTVTVDLPKCSMCIARSRETIKENRSKYFKNVFDKKYFGTDGIRGVYGEFLTDEIAYMTGNFLGYSSNGNTIVVGRDNRISGNALSSAIIKGATDAGADVIDLGVVSTPCTAFVTQNIGANYGIVISASHNPWQYNGIKIFNFDGRKLADIEEVEIEKHISKNMPFLAEKKGHVLHGQDNLNSYLNVLKQLIGDLKGLKIAIDCSNGAVSKYAPKLFEELGANITAYNTLQDGKTINDNCGALYPNFIAQKVVEGKFDVGFSFDGDADRLIAVNEKGQIVNGDSIIYIISKYLKRKDKLINNAVVGTLHTNMGVEQSLSKLGIKLVRTDIGDHYVMERMMRDNLLVGGEQSGHIILREFSNTGDGILASLYLCKLMINNNKTLYEMDNSIHFPQININIITKNKKEIMSDAKLASFIKKEEIELGDKGRILLRASGTEPKIRIMAECIDNELAQITASKIESYICNNFEL